MMQVDQAKELLEKVEKLKLQEAEAVKLRDYEAAERIADEIGAIEAKLGPTAAQPSTLSVTASFIPPPPMPNAQPQSSLAPRVVPTATPVNRPAGEAPPDVPYARPVTIPGATAAPPTAAGAQAKGKTSAAGNVMKNMVYGIRGFAGATDEVKISKQVDTGQHNVQQHVHRPQQHACPLCQITLPDHHVDLVLLAQATREAKEKRAKNTARGDVVALEKRNVPEDVLNNAQVSSCSSHRR